MMRAGQSLLVSKLYESRFFKVLASSISAKIQSLKSSCSKNVRYKERRHAHAVLLVVIPIDQSGHFLVVKV